MIDEWSKLVTGKIPISWQGLIDMQALPKETSGANVTSAGTTQPSVLSPWKCWGGLAGRSASLAKADNHPIVTSACWYLDFDSEWNDYLRVSPIEGARLAPVPSMSPTRAPTYPVSENEFPSTLPTEPKDMSFSSLPDTLDTKVCQYFIVHLSFTIMCVITSLNRLISCGEEKHPCGQNMSMPPIWNADYGPEVELSQQVCGVSTHHLKKFCPPVVRVPLLMQIESSRPLRVRQWCCRTFATDIFCTIEGWGRATSHFMKLMTVFLSDIIDHISLEHLKLNKKYIAI